MGKDWSATAANNNWSRLIMQWLPMKNGLLDNQSGPVVHQTGKGGEQRERVYFPQRGFISHCRQLLRADDFQSLAGGAVLLPPLFPQLQRFCVNAGVINRRNILSCNFNHPLTGK